MGISGRNFSSGSAADAASTRASVPPAPRRPGPRARRLVFGFGGGLKVALILGIAFTAMGLPFTFVFAGSIPSDIAIAATRHWADGQVLSAQLDTSAEVNGRHPTIVRFTYSFQGQRYESQSSAVDDGLLSLKENAPLSIEVAAIRPSWARVAGTTRSWTGYFGSFVVLFPVVGIVVMVRAIRARRRAARAFEHGRPATAKVVFAGWDTTYSVNDRHPFKVAWEFIASDGNVYTGSLSSMRELDLEPFAQAGQVTVLYDPADPRMNTLWVEG